MTKHSPNTGEKWEQEELEKIGRVINKAWKDAESGKYNCKACGASPGTEHKNDCKWLVRKRNEKTKPSKQECKCDTNIFCPIHQPPQKKDKRTYEETLETVRKLSKLMQKEGWVQMCFWTNKHKEVVDAIHSVKGVRVDDFIVSENDIILALEQEHKNLLATERQEHEILVNTLLATKNAELKKERQKVEEMIREKISNCTGMEDNDGRFYYDADEIDEVFEQLRTNKGGREG